MEFKTRSSNDHNLYEQEEAKFKERIMGEKCKKVDNYIGGKRSSDAWKLIRTLKQNNTNKINIQLIQIDQWKQHYSRELKECNISHAHPHHTLCKNIM